MSSAPAINLYDYQKRWVSDDSRFKVALKCRQSGFSFGTALEIALDAASRRTLWVCLSAGERQSKELMSTVAMHCAAIGAAGEVLESWYKVDDDQFKMLEISLPNGSRIVGLPANPSTARGWSGNVFLDEFAFHKDSRKIWRALYPTITRGYKIRVVSTPSSKTDKFYELWTDTSRRWSKHKVDIYAAVADGLPLDIDELREGCSSEDDWLQEYCCEFLDENDSLLTYELITACEVEMRLDLPAAFNPQGDLYLGMDIGRKRDLTVIWLCEQIGDVAWTRTVIPMRKARFAVQRETVFGLLELPRLRRAEIDATGIGAQLAEEARERFGYRVEPVEFTHAVKEELAINQRRRFEDRTVRIPADREIRNELHAVKKISTAAGHMRYDAERTEAGHADYFWALALCLHAMGFSQRHKPAKVSAKVVA